MKQQNKSITIQQLTKEISLLIRDEFIATYKEEDTKLHIHFLNGQNFLIEIQEF